MAKLLYALTHIPQVVLPLFNSLGNWTYVILFSLIFMETGLVVFPWLPGQSLIFVTSSFAALHGAEVKMGILVPGFFIAAVLGDTLNYLIGTRLIKWPWLNQRLAGPTMEKAQLFFSRYGLRAIIFGRFVPLIRTLCPADFRHRQIPLWPLYAWQCLRRGHLGSLRRAGGILSWQHSICTGPFFNAAAGSGHLRIFASRLFQSHQTDPPAYY